MHGIDVRHRASCAVPKPDGRCCDAAWQAHVYDSRTGKRIRKTFQNKGAAKTWRQDMLVALRRGEITAASSSTLLSAAVEDWLRAAEAGTVRTRGRRPFAPSTVVAARQAWSRNLRNPSDPDSPLPSLCDTFGKRRIDRVTLLDLQDHVDLLDGAGVNPSTIETQVLPLRLVYRRLKGRGEVSVDPTDGLELPEKTSRGKRVPPAPAHAAALLAIVPIDVQALWATAMLAGLRRGELAALTWDDVDLDAGVLRVERSWDYSSGARPTKSRHGKRTVPITRTLAPHLREHALRQGRGRAGLVFGITATEPFRQHGPQRIADAAWKAARLDRVTLHACRHLYASLSIAAGVNAHALCKYMGHSSIAVTYDLYGHMFPGNESEAAALLDGYLDKVFEVAATA
jgi:integrase